MELPLPLHSSSSSDERKDRSGARGGKEEEEEDRSGSSVQHHHHANVVSPCSSHLVVDLDATFKRNLGQAQGLWISKQKRSRFIDRLLGVLTVVFLINLVAFLPLAIHEFEGWNFASSFYFSVQSGLGIGFGALSVEQKGTQLLVLVHIVLAAPAIAFVLSRLLIRVMDIRKKGALKKDNDDNNKPDSLPVGDVQLGIETADPGSYRVLKFTLILLLGVIFGGVAFSMLYEDWDFVAGLYFVISGCQTSGLLAPTIQEYDEHDLFSPLFVSLLMILGVPAWACVIGHVTGYLILFDQRQKSLSSAIEREKRAEEGFRRLRGQLSDVTNGGKQSKQDNNNNGAAVADRADFLSLWLLRSSMVQEETLRAMNQEFSILLEHDGSDEQGYKNEDLELRTVPTVQIWKINARLHFWQLVEQGVAQVDDWPQLCEKMRPQTA